MGCYRNVYKAKLIITQLSQSRTLSSYEIRNRFIDYFTIEYSHTFIRSSPVVPLHDQSLAFVNAGMNQFKEVFLNNAPLPCPRAANSQKCIRVGGKHNDLRDVGRDSYHHTFFEMLGNWSFGDYFKQEACELAWRLLTSPPYSIDPRRLYVTYFTGCSVLGLPPDHETKEIWLALGVLPDHILGFGPKENLWEMGRSGPCGPCTEIHVDLLDQGPEAATRVNKGFADVTELWNIVFIQNNRNVDGSLSELPRRHIDTGMGLERLVALLQNKSSNYDSDLFVHLFNAIAKSSRTPAYRGRLGAEDEVGLDTAYRVLADHSRMVTVAIADNMFPDHNHKLRRVLRKALLVAEQSFKAKQPPQLLREVCSRVADSLAGTYPEIAKNLNKVHLVVEREWELLRGMRNSAGTMWRTLVAEDSRLAQLSCEGSSGLCAAYRELTSSTPPLSRVPGHLAYRLYDTLGVHPELIDELCQVLGLEFDEDEFNAALAEAKEKSVPLIQSKTQVLLKSSLENLKCSVPVTDDSGKYKYKRTTDTDGQLKYEFPEVQGKVQAVLREGEIVEGEAEVVAGETLGLVLDRTCLYHEAGGQQSDSGELRGDGWTLICDQVVNCSGFLVHQGTLSTSQRCRVAAGCPVSVKVNEKQRLSSMRNHTATHLLHSALHSLFMICHQRGSLVTQQKLVFDFATYGKPVTKEVISDAERRVQEVVKAKLPVTRTTVSASELASLDDVTLIPGETYPSHDIHLVEILGENFISKEACCGTHVLNTADLEDFCVTEVGGASQGSVTAVTGQFAAQARQNGQQALLDVATLLSRIQTAADGHGSSNEELEQLDSCLQMMKNQLSETSMPHDVRTQATSKLESGAKLIRDSARLILRTNAEQEMKQVLEEATSDARGYLVHSVSASSTLDSLSLQKLTRLCPPDLPVLVFSYSEGQLKARCCVPQAKVDKGVSAEAWLGPVAVAVGGSGGAPRGQDPHLVYNMRPLHIPSNQVSQLIDRALQEAHRIANKLFHN